MPDITFVSEAGERTVVAAATGQSVMRAATANFIDGIDADCGGCCTCATCHVYVDEAQAGVLPPPTDDELGMLECAMNPRANSRLSCQIEVTEELDGMVFQIPPRY